MKWEMTFAHDKFPEPIKSHRTGAWIKARTTCYLVVNGDEAYTAAECSRHDQFNKELGRRLSLMKAMDYLRFNRLERAHIGNAYHARVLKGEIAWPPVPTVAATSAES